MEQCQWRFTRTMIGGRKGMPVETETLCDVVSHHTAGAMKANGDPEGKDPGRHKKPKRVLAPTHLHGRYSHRIQEMGDVTDGRYEKESPVLQQMSRYMYIIIIISSSISTATNCSYVYHLQRCKSTKYKVQDRR